jgi:hypothetical protein
MQHPYKKLGGWLLALIVAQSIAIVIIAIASITVIAELCDWFEFLPANYKTYVVIAIFVIIAELTAFCGFVYMVVTRNSRFLQFFDALMLINTLFAVFGMLAIEFDWDGISELLGGIISFVVLTIYYRKSVRVRTYMGGDEYLRLSIFSKNAVAPQPVAPDGGAAAKNAKNGFQPFAYSPAAGSPLAAAPVCGGMPQGYELESVCPRCGRENPTGKFCQRCGMKLAVVKSPPGGEPNGQPESTPYQTPVVELESEVTIIPELYSAPTTVAGYESEYDDTVVPEPGYGAAVAATPEYDDTVVPEPEYDAAVISDDELEPTVVSDEELEPTVVSRPNPPL